MLWLSAFREPDKEDCYFQNLLMADVDLPSLRWSHGELQVPTELREGRLLDPTLVWGMRAALASTTPAQEAKHGVHIVASGRGQETQKATPQPAPPPQHIYIFLLSNMFC